jgi:hypothetical protein
VAGIRIGVRPGGVLIAAGMVRVAGTGAAAAKTARAAGCVQGPFAWVREVWCA